MCAAFGDVCTLASDLICVDLYCDTYQGCLLFFSVPVMCQCASLVFILSFYGKMFYLDSFDISARLSMFVSLCWTWRFAFTALTVLDGRREECWPIVSMYVCISVIDYVCLLIIHDVQ